MSYDDSVLKFKYKNFGLFYNVKGPTKQRKPKAKKQCPKNDPMQAFKTTIIVSGIVLAVAGAIFAITKKLKEK